MKRSNSFVEKSCFVCVLFNVIVLLLCILILLTYKAHAEEPKDMTTPVQSSVQQPQVVHVPRTVVLELLCIHTVYEKSDRYNAVMDGVLVDDGVCMPIDEFLFRINCVPANIQFNQYTFRDVPDKHKYSYTVTCTK